MSEDRELADAVARSGDETAFRALYRRHTPALYRLALRLGGGDGPWAEELVQRTWIRAIDGLGSFAWRSSLSSWLGGIAINCARELWREARTRSETALAEEMPLAAPRLSAPEERVDLERAIEGLPAGYREIFVLHDVEGYTHEEIGGLLGIETGTSKSQLSRARQRLRAALAPTD
ncbi:MAG TPA: RNA polymerase sigma factor [Solirubrobacterales bacterium]|nr:RNA polymerase sigma factor [Solirubrobacterales bacterium]